MMARPRPSQGIAGLTLYVTVCRLIACSLDHHLAEGGLPGESNPAAPAAYGAAPLNGSPAAEKDRADTQEKAPTACRDLGEMSRQLQQTEEELASLAYAVAHDLRAPLRAIDGFSQALLEDYTGQLDAQGQDYLQRLYAAGQRMGQLIDGLLALSRVMQAPIRPEPVDLSQLARKVAAQFRQAHPERQVECVIADGLIARGDVALLQVVLQNLLDNAWKFTARRSRARVEFGETTGADGRAFFVHDDGVGFDMASASAQRLFGPFQRLHAAGEFPGIGIGLAIVQRIVHRHGGRVWAESAVGKGATFYFSL